MVEAWQPPAGGMDVDGAALGLVRGALNCGLDLGGRFTAAPYGDCWDFWVRLAQGVPVEPWDPSKAATGMLSPADQWMVVRICQPVDEWGHAGWTANATIIDVGPAQEVALAERSQSLGGGTAVNGGRAGTAEEAVQRVVCPMVSNGRVVAQSAPRGCRPMLAIVVALALVVVSGAVAAFLLAAGDGGPGGEPATTLASGVATTAATSGRLTADEYHDRAGGRSYVKLCVAGVRSGDVLDITIRTPNGESLTQGTIVGNAGTATVLFDVTGSGPGTYTVRVVHFGDGSVLETSTEFGDSEGTPACLG